MKINKKETAILNEQTQKDKEENTLSTQEIQIPACFVSYKQLLSHINIFNNQQNFSKFISLLTTENSTFFKAFFDIIIGKDLEIEYSNIPKAKKSLEKNYNLLLKNLEELKKSKVPPQNAVQFAILQDYPFIPEVVVLVEFTNRFISTLTKIQSIEDYQIEYRQFFQKPKSSYSVSNPTKRNSLLKQQQPNQTIKVSNLAKLSFKWRASDLEQLYHTDKIFKAQIPLVLDILRPIQVQKLEELKEKQKIDHIKLQEIDEIHSRAMKIKVNKSDILAQISYQNSPQGVHLFYEFLFELTMNTETQARKKKTTLFQKYSKLLVDFSEIIDLNEKQIALLRSNLTENEESFLGSKGIFCYKMFLNLLCLLKINDAGLNKDQWQQFNDARQNILQLSKLHKALIK